jgi:hypothetical protein
MLGSLVVCWGYWKSAGVLGDVVSVPWVWGLWDT